MKEKLFTKNYVIMIIVGALAFTASFMISSTTPQHCISMGGTKATAGFLTSAYTLAAFIARPVWGQFTDRKGRKIVLYAGIVMCVFALVLLFNAKIMVMLFVARIVFGAGLAGVTTSSGTMIADIVPKTRFSDGIAFYGVASVFSQAVAPALALYLYDFGFHWVLITVFCLIVCATVSAFFVKYNEKALIAVPDKTKKPGSVIEVKALPAAATVIFMAISSSAAFAFVPLLGKERAIVGISVFFTSSAVGLLISRVAGLGASRKFGEAPVFYCGAFGYAVGFLFLAFGYSEVMVGIAGFLYGCGSGFAHPIMNAIAVRSVEPNRRGSATSTFMMSQDIGMAIGSTVWGLVANHFGFTVVYILVTFVALLLLVAFKIFLSKGAQKKLVELTPEV